MKYLSVVNHITFLMVGMMVGISLLAVPCIAVDGSQYGVSTTISVTTASLTTTEIDCKSKPCQYNGTCTEYRGKDGTQHICYCRPGYGGKFCENEVTDCRILGCNQGGTCSSRERYQNYTCFCYNVFAGKYCERAKSLCYADQFKRTVCSNTQDRNKSYYLSVDPHQVCKPETIPSRRRRQTNQNYCSCKKNFIFGGVGEEKLRCFKPCNHSDTSNQCDVLEECKVFPYYSADNSTGWCGCKAGYAKINGTCKIPCANKQNCTEVDSTMSCVWAFTNPNNIPVSTCECQKKGYLLGSEQACVKGCRGRADCPMNEICMPFLQPRGVYEGYCKCAPMFIRSNGQCSPNTCRPGYYKIPELEHQGCIEPGCACRKCPADHYQDGIDQNMCKGCPPHSTTHDRTGAASIDECDFVPYLSDFYPPYGPAAGGTRVVMHVPYLNDTARRVTIAGHPCRDVSHLNGSTVTCVTGRLYEYQPPFDGVVRLFTQTDARSGVLVSTTKYEYRRNPNITSVQNLDTFISGGKQILVEGEDLNSAAAPLMNITRVIRDSQKDFLETCMVNSSTKMTCTIPNLAEGLSQEERAKLFSLDSRSYYFSVGFKFDGFNRFENLSAIPRLAKSARLNVYRDPRYDRFPLVDGGWHMKTIYPEEDGLLVLKGERLTSGCKLEDIEVTIGQYFCIPTKLTSNQLTCRPPKTQPPHEETDYGPRKTPAVTVLLGFARPAHLSYSIGYLEYVQASNAAMIAGIVVALIILLIVCAIVAYLLHRRRQQRRGKGVYKPEIESEMAYMKPLRDAANLADSNAYVGGNNSGSAQRLDDGGYLKPVNILDLLDQELRLTIAGLCIARERLTLADLIGKGNFGKVYKGTLTEPDLTKPRTVAVKTTQGKSSGTLYKDEITEFFEEAIIMKDFNHMNVLSLLGVVIEENSPHVVLPYMELGDLKSYISNPEIKLTIRDLLGFGEQICNGMVYLASHKFVHRDLATRNCMLNSSNIVKIADFGLSRDIYTTEYYRIEDTSRPLPVKWMALESLKTHTFTIKSDVWSFGVVMWELMTRGIVPYPDVDSFKLKDYLTQGYRLSKPDNCLDVIYDLMMECWKEDPEMRPTFGELNTKIGLLTAQSNRKDPDPEYMQVI